MSDDDHRGPSLSGSPGDAHFEIARPFTVPHFRSFAQNLILDTGYPWQIEDFQIELLTPILDGITEVWAIIPEGNGKTSVMAAFALYHLFFTRAPWVPIVASSRDQADILAQQAYGIIRATPGLEWDPKAQSGYFRVYEGYRRIGIYKRDVTGRRYQDGRGAKVYAADVGTSDGGIPTLVLCDEGHRWPDLSPYRLWKGKLGKRGGQIVMISTAGAPGEDFEETCERICERAADKTHEGCHSTYISPNIVLNKWAVEKPEYISDMGRVKEANPFSNITEEGLQAEFEAPTMDLGNWRRLKCNLAARTVNVAITEEEWDGAQVQMSIPPGAHVDLGMDVAWKLDTFALVPLWKYDPDELEEENEGDEKGFYLIGESIVIEPPRDGSMIHPDTVKMAFDEINDVNPVNTAVIDMQRAEDIAAWLEDERSIQALDRTNSNSTAVEDYDAFMKELRNKTLRHTGQRVLKQHVMNAIARQLPGDKKRFDRPSQSRAKRKQSVRVIDALTAAAMVVQYAGEYQGGGTPMVAWR